MSSQEPNPCAQRQLTALTGQRLSRRTLLLRKVRHGETLLTVSSSTQRKEKRDTRGSDFLPKP